MFRVEGQALQETNVKQATIGALLSLSSLRFIIR
jgi:hypothetical protein